MIEKAVLIGTEFKLSGVVTMPEAPDENLEAFVILNSGLMHKIGTCRTSVTLARQVANTNRIVLRFDLSGIGDSEPRGGGASDDDRVYEEIIAALDYLQSHYSVSKFILYGLCSGAQNSFKAAQRDERIVGLVGIDGYSYRTLKFYAVHYLPRMLKLSVWRQFFSKLCSSIQNKICGSSLATEPDSANSDDVSDIEPENVWPAFPSRKSVEAGYQQLVQNGVRFNIIFTGSWFEIYNYEKQFFDMYSKVHFGNLLSLNLFADANHIMSEPEFQEKIRFSIVQWLDA